MKNYTTKIDYPGLSQSKNRDYQSDFNLDFVSLKFDENQYFFFTGWPSRHYHSLRLSGEETVHKEFPNCLSSKRSFLGNTFEAVLLIFPTSRFVFITMGSILSRSVHHVAHISGNNNQIWMIHGGNFNISSMFDQIMERVTNKTENIIKRTEDFTTANNLVVAMNQVLMLILIVLFIIFVHWICNRGKPSAKTNIIGNLNTISVPCSTFRI